MAALNWPAIQDFFDTFTINVFKCKLCTQFATTDRENGIVHIVEDHASVQQDGVIVVFHSNSQDADVTEKDQLEEVRVRCEHGLSKWYAGTRDSVTQTDDVVSVDVATEMDSATVPEVGKALPVLQKSREEPGTAESDETNLKKKLSKEDLKHGSTLVAPAGYGVESCCNDDDLHTVNDMCDENESAGSTSKTDDFEEFIDNDSETASEIQETRVLKRKQDETSQINPSTEDDKVVAAGGSTLRQIRTRAGLRSPDKCKRKVYHGYIQEDVVLKETGIRNSDMPLKCDKCDFTADHAKSLTRHKLTHRAKKVRKKNVVRGGTENTTNVDNSGKEARKNNDDTNGRKIPDLPKACKVCGFLCKSEKGFKIHMHKHEEQRKARNIECNDCGKLFTSRQGMIKHKRDKWCRKGVPKAYKRYKCDVCDKQFHNKGIYKEHLTVHSAVRSYNCEQCEKSFKTFRALKRHNASHSSDPYKCSLCDFTTFWPGSLKVHYVGKHDSESRELQQCPHCSFTTRSAWYISRHIALHSEERPFVCEHCGKSFKSDIVLRAHLETHNEKTFPCDDCDYVGNTKAAIYNHRQCHLPKEQMHFKCDQCDWVGKRKTEFQIHQRKHSALKLFRCGHCGHSYKHKHGLTRHLKEKHIVKAITTIPEVIFPDLDLEVQEASMALSSLPVAQFFEISTATEILADSNSQE